MAKLKVRQAGPAVVQKRSLIRMMPTVSSGRQGRQAKQISVSTKSVVKKPQAVKKLGRDLVRSVSKPRTQKKQQVKAVSKKVPYVPDRVSAVKPRSLLRPSYKKKVSYRDQSPKRKGPRPKIDVKYSNYYDKIKKLEGTGKGRVLIIVACGPSVKEAPLELLIDHPKIDFMLINQPYGFYADRCPEKHRGIWPPKYWVFCDHSQYKRNMDAWSKYKGIIINSSAVRANHPRQIVVKHRGGKGFSKDLANGYHIGRSTTYANMQTAWYMGYDKIYIFGLDMGEVDGKLHHYGQNPDVSPANRKGRFASEAEHYSFAARSMTGKERKRFIICSSYNKWPFTQEFQSLDHKNAPEIILQNINGVKDTTNTG